MHFTIITPSLNYGRFLGDCLESVAAQQGVTLEHLVIDGGSTDNSAAVAAEFPNAVWSCGKDGGMSEAINKGFDKATGNLEGANYIEIRYEGYGIGGAAIIVDCMTDNRFRTVAAVRNAFSRYGGTMGAEGAVAFQFKHCGQLIFAPGTDEDKLMEAALDAGAQDVITGDDGAIEVLTAYPEFEAVKNALEAAGFNAEVAEITMRADTMVDLGVEESEKMQKLLDALENLDDVQAVYSNATLAE